jgi:hypothetical protein
VIDKVEGIHEVAEARFHFHPLINLQINDTKGKATLPDGETVYWQIEIGNPRLEASTWHPSFGEIVPNVCLSVKLVDGVCITKFFWNNTSKVLYI